MPRAITVLVVDQNPLLREGLSILLGLEPDIELVGSAETAAEAIRLFAHHRPDVTLIDLDLPSGSATAVIQSGLKMVPTACFIGLMTFEWDGRCSDAIRAGARKCIPKDRLNQDLLGAIRECDNRDDHS
jgi:DNA-binding NarL/FixJ family response regulator